MFAFDDLESADSRADENPDAISVFLGDLQAGLLQCLLRGSKGKVNEARHLTRFLFVDEFQRVKVLDLGGKGDRKSGGIKTRDRPHTAGAGYQFLPHLLRGI